ncbi:hypothetical protein CO251_04800 [Sulfobacillus sp. hq2]|nr:hypothetical protein CO251_04800 [Sulfobacillus sp. hq2]
MCGADDEHPADMADKGLRERMNNKQDLPGIGFTTRQRWVSGLIAGLGAIFVGISVMLHARIHSRISTIAINEKQPVNVLVGIRGTSQAPAFIGFLAVVRPNSQVLTVIPVNGTTLVSTVNGTEQPLYEVIAGETPVAATKSVSQAMGVPITHYFYFTTKDLLMVMNALYYHTNHLWPQTETPTAMLATLGYPDGAANPAGQVQLLGKIVQMLPEVTPIAAGELLGMTKNSTTNLTAYQVFALANYIRGDALKLGSLRQLRPIRRSHG